VLLPSVLLLQEHMERNAADTIPTHRATRGFSGGYRALGDRRAYHSSGARCRLPSLAGTNAPGLRGAPAGSYSSHPATNDVRSGSRLCKNAHQPKLRRKAAQNCFLNYLSRNRGCQYN